MLSFIAALYNEESEIVDLLNHINPYVDFIYLTDDGSTDDTYEDIWNWGAYYEELDKMSIKRIPHTGLPETVKNEALTQVPAGSWVLMLDADERFADGVLPEITQFVNGPECKKVDYVYFQQLEIIDGIHVRTFQKSKLFRKEHIRFSTGIHEDDQFTGEGIFKENWIVHHRKSTQKQVIRENEYVQTYKKLLAEGKIDEGRYRWLIGLHHYIKE